VADAAPEAVLYIPVAYEALVRETALPAAHLERATLLLAEELHRAFLRRHPDAVRAVEEVLGTEAGWRATQYLASVGFPRRRPAPPPARGGGTRRTPPFIRALWPTCREAVDAFAWAVSDIEEHERVRLALACAWGIYTVGMMRHRWYRDDTRARYGKAAPSALWYAFEVIGR
jgi:hypothetical protein